MPQWVLLASTIVDNVYFRFVLADTDKLHQKLAEMSRRIRQLEDALQVEYGSRTTESHPLLSEELLAVKSGIDYRVRGQVGDVDGEDVDFKADLTDEACSGAMGLLTISEGGAVRFLGATGYEVYCEAQCSMRWQLT